MEKSYLIGICTSILISLIHFYHNLVIIAGRFQSVNFKLIPTFEDKIKIINFYSSDVFAVKKPNKQCFVQYVFFILDILLVNIFSNFQSLNFLKVEIKTRQGKEHSLWVNYNFFWRS